MNGKILSYSAGSTSLDPFKFRVIDSQKPSDKMTRLAAIFPQFQPFFGDPLRSLVVDAYPAALGGMDAMTRVITYLHPPTCIRALRLAAAEDRRAVFIAQPLAGADLLLQALETQMDWPSELLWATGGYPLPASLQRSVEAWLAEYDCQLTVLQAYGVAELDHTLMASMDRDAASRPIYHLVDPRLELDVQEEVCSLKTHIHFEGKKTANHDRIESCGEDYRIHGNASLYCDGALGWLEQWQPNDWRNYTGYLSDRNGAILLQQRRGQTSDDEVAMNCLSLSALASLPRGLDCRPVEHYDFMSQDGMSWMEKPSWNPTAFRPLDARTNADSVAAAA